MNRISQLNNNPYLRHAQPQRVFARGLRQDPGQEISLRGMCKEALDFITREQLMDRALWAKLVEQFRLKSDTEKQEWRNEYWGKMMRGAAFVYSVTEDPALYDVLEETVEDLLSTQDADGAFSTYAPEVQFTKWDIWGRKYVLLGLLCFREICRDQTLSDRILVSAKRHGDAILARVGNDSEEKIQIEQTSLTVLGQQVHGTMNSLSILEPMVLLYRETGEQRYLDFATYLVETGARACGNIFELAYVDRLAPYQYPYTKAYEMMSCFEGLLEYAQVVGSEKWKKAAIQFAYRMMESDITVLGSAGTANEFLNHASVHQVESSGQDVGQETCVSVTWMKLCARMLLVTGDWLGDNVQSVWFSCVNYRANLFQKAGRLFFRDLRYFDDQVTEPHLDTPCLEWRASYGNLPLADNRLWSEPGREAGLFFHDPVLKLEALKERSAEELEVLIRFADGHIGRILFIERRILFENCGMMQWDFGTGNILQAVEKDRLVFQAKDTAYELGVVGIAQPGGEGVRIEPADGIISLDFPEKSVTGME